MEADTIQKRQHSEKAAAILAGAMQEFLAHGYAATSMDRVAAAAGVSKATVYNHFQDKEGLFTALIRQLAQEKFQAVFTPQDYHLEGEPSVVLRHLATTMLDNAMSDRQLHDFMRVVISESGRFPELARAYVDNIAKPAIETLSQYFARSDLKLADPEATVRVVVGTLIYYIILQELMHGKDILPMKRDRLVDTLVDLIAPQ